MKSKIWHYNLYNWSSMTPPWLKYVEVFSLFFSSKITLKVPVHECQPRRLVFALEQLALHSPAIYIQWTHIINLPFFLFMISMTDTITKWAYNWQQYVLATKRSMIWIITLIVLKKRNIIQLISHDAHSKIHILDKIFTWEKPTTHIWTLF